ncbi:hypothetical protein MF672_039040 [Actinomadura sp. ATCC 31491]|uniref:4Fe-4S ferredoxin-type domain-containing protein n=1 Tax=Actinomadura luzonensis TaxID=2805427 RepID=A0ABT0G6N1_9ACTN|nr:hypothetical protein [Actinomadura luzonensis]MCK2219751.1 hypothetical protein [Actinomadura luzonensis]
MTYESRAYDNEHGDPVVVLVVTGTHDVSRIVNLLAGNRMALCEHMGVSEQILRQVRRHNGGRAALKLLAAHGGPDLTQTEIARVTAQEYHASRDNVTGQVELTIGGPEGTVVIDLGEDGDEILLGLLDIGQDDPDEEPLIDPDCRDGKCGSCVGGPCEHDCHQAGSEAAR